jgi:hypothetical protein
MLGPRRRRERQSRLIKAPRLPAYLPKTLRGGERTATAPLSQMQEARSRWTLTGLLSAWGLIPATIREAFPATGVDSTRDRIGRSCGQMTGSHRRPRRPSSKMIACCKLAADDRWTMIHAGVVMVRCPATGREPFNRRRNGCRNI